MKKWIAVALILLLACGLAGCKAQKDDLKFYVLKKADVTDSMVDSALLQAAKEKGRIAFTAEDIKGWYWQEQKVYLQDVSVLGGQKDGGSALFQAEAEDVFLLVLGNRVLYSGGFQAAGSTVSPLREIYIKDGEEDSFSIACRKEYEAAEDPRNQTVLYNYLAEQQLLASGEANVK